MIPVVGADYFARQLPKFFKYSPRVIPSVQQMAGFPAARSPLNGVRLLADPRIVTVQIAIIGLGTLAALWSTWRIASRELVPVSRSSVGIRVASLSLVAACGIAAACLYAPAHAGRGLAGRGTMTLQVTDEAPRLSSQLQVTVLTDRCAGCQECVIRCPAGALSMDASRWVAIADDALCIGCRQCERTCPFSAITVDGPLAVAARIEPAPAHPGRSPGSAGEVRPGFVSWDDALAEASRCLDCPDPTCVRGCPAHNDVPSFIRAVRAGDLGQAHDVLRRTSMLPDVCSRVCNQSAQCEGACTWSLAGGTPVAIGKLERFVADNAPVPPPARKSGSGAGLSVAVVGSRTRRDRRGLAARRGRSVGDRV